MSDHRTRAVTTVVVDGRYNGPPASGNGGYVCGTVADLVGTGPDQVGPDQVGPVQVRLHRPPPLQRSLGWDGARLLDGSELVAEAAAWQGERPQLPPAVTVGQARAAARSFPGLTVHPFPACFSCGPDRAATDGLRIFPGPVPGTALVAAAWRPDPATFTTDGHGRRGDATDVPTPILWSALDCSGGWACAFPAASVAVLGSMTGQVLRPVTTGEDLVVTAMPAGAEGRKRYAVSAVRTTGGELLAWSQQVWIELQPCGRSSSAP